MRNVCVCRIVLVLATIRAVSLSAQTNPVVAAAETITAAEVTRHVGVIADDSMLGRNTPSPELEKTAQYVADHFKRLGLTPGGDHGTWLQRYPLPNDSMHTASNVIAVLEGSDSKLKKEYVVFTAHMDHIGAGRGHGPVTPEVPFLKNSATRNDSIYNGASDDASGTAGLIELAKAFSQAGARPRRSVIFLASSGKERGLWGSAYFLKHPVVPIQQIVAAINFDGLGRINEDDALDNVKIVGKKFSSLGALFDSVVAAHPELHFPVTTNAASNPDLAQFFNLDQFRFAESGIPGLSFTEGQFYAVGHWPDDAPDKFDAGRVVQIVRLAFHFGRAVGNANQRPVWDNTWYGRIFLDP